MKPTPLKILLICGDETISRRIRDLLLGAPRGMELTVEPTTDAGLAMVATNNFNAILFEIPQKNTAALFQITRLAIKAPQ